MFAPLLLAATLAHAQDGPPANPPVCIGHCPDDTAQAPETGRDSDTESATSAPGLGMSTVFIGAVCLNLAPGQVDCLHDSGNHIAARFGRIIVDAVVADGLFADLEVQFPAVRSTVMARAMFTLEKRLIKLVDADLRAKLLHTEPMAWETSEDRARERQIIDDDRVLIDQWLRDARKEARHGDNWRAAGASAWTFHAGPAYYQLDNAVTGNRWTPSRP